MPRIKRKARTTETVMIADLGGGGGPEWPPPDESLRDPPGDWGRELSSEEAEEEAEGEGEGEMDAY
jgi:hypothetical protein